MFGAFVIMNEQVILGPFNRYLVFYVFLNGFNVKCSVLIGHGDGHAFGPGPGGASYAMDVVFSILGQVVVDDVGYPFNMQSP